MANFKIIKHIQKYTVSRIRLLATAKYMELSNYCLINFIKSLSKDEMVFSANLGNIYFIFSSIKYVEY